MLVIGLTGPSGAGKNAVSDLFASFGLPVLDADEIYHALLIPPSPCLRELVLTFGQEILNPDGTLNRRALGAIVFSDTAQLQQLNEISHRFVMAEIRKRMEQYRADETRAVILNAPQLFEAGAERDCNIIVSVLADPETRLSRIMHRDGIDAETAERRMRAQKSDAFFRSHSNYIIENNGSLDNAVAAVRRILAETGVTSP